VTTTGLSDLTLHEMYWVTETLVRKESSLLKAVKQSIIGNNDFSTSVKDSQPDKEQSNNLSIYVVFISLYSSKQLFYKSFSTITLISF
jgi:hypothetical protein